MVTEGEEALLPAGGHVLTSGDDYGYRPVEGRRKVLLWSRRPWRSPDTVGDPALPPGRYAAGTTRAPGGDVRVVGVCVPWRDAHVRTGRRDRAAWVDHLAYLAPLGSLLARERAAHGRLVVAGDLNQRIPRRRQPVVVAAALERALEGLAVVTAGQGCEGRDLIDHVAVAPPPGGACRVTCLPRGGPDGRSSDHDAVVVDLPAG